MQILSSFSLVRPKSLGTFLLKLLIGVVLYLSLYYSKELLPRINQPALELGRPELVIGCPLGLVTYCSTPLFANQFVLSNGAIIIALSLQALALGIALYLGAVTRLMKFFFFALLLAHPLASRVLKLASHEEWLALSNGAGWFAPPLLFVGFCTISQRKWLSVALGVIIFLASYSWSVSETSGCYCSRFGRTASPFD